MEESERIDCDPCKLYANWYPWIQTKLKENVQKGLSIAVCQEGWNQISWQYPMVLGQQGW